MAVQAAAAAAAAAADQDDGGLSKRALPALTAARSRGGKGLAKVFTRRWSEEDPDGNIIVMVAQNKLTTDLLHEKLQAVQPIVPSSTLGYPVALKGFPEARKAMASMMQRTFMKGVDVQADNIALLTGTGAVLELLFWCLAEPGDGVLLPTPIYPTFLNDMSVRAGAHAALFELREDTDIAAQLTAAAEAAAAEGHPVRIMLLAHPNNPMGIVYKRSTVRDILLWCADHDVHLMSDEIYANSVWGSNAEAAEFASAEVIAQQELQEGRLTPAQAERIPRILHIVYGLSKDFCASGLRVGVLHTRNQALISAVGALAYFHGCSTPMLWAMTQVLNDEDFIDHFIAENNRRLAAAYKGLADALDAHGIPHVRACSAMFCWMDLRAGLLEDSWEGEQQLWQALVDAGVVMYTGQQCKASEPGFFRMTWACVPAAALPVAVQRIAKVLQARQAQKQQGSQAAGF